MNLAGVEVVEKTVSAEEEKGLMLDGGFVVPLTNSFGHTFRSLLPSPVTVLILFLNWATVAGFPSLGLDLIVAQDSDARRRKGTAKSRWCGDNVTRENNGDNMVKRMREEYGKLNRLEMSIWECCELLNDVIDESDPDLDEPQIEHLLQTAEAIRKDYPNEDWLHLTGLIHDLGKVLHHPAFGELPQWAVVGDTFPVGCAFDESVVHHKYFKENPDFTNPTFNTKYGVYSEGCGLDNVMMSWGHDDYMYLVAKENKTTLPSAGLFIIRYHSFYAMHKAGAYKHLMNEEDMDNLKWLKIFNKYDLYSKSKVRIDVEKVKPYYLSLIEKYFPTKLRW
ncbi:hypothetical protein TIFTF001_030733 [Ficus carica]|uniref:Inositol oxygenase n=1 Tax=Ficus carica TaxID=3494 RepID=A0AA88J5D5_FICCA|nr:hypothetical protein TIFTF001_030733 [Ficus carica]